MTVPKDTSARLEIWDDLVAYISDIVKLAVDRELAPPKVMGFDADTWIIIREFAESDLLDGDKLMLSGVELRHEP